VSRCRHLVLFGRKDAQLERLASIHGLQAVQGLAGAEAGDRA
jgi:hypothetical protein